MNDAASYDAIMQCNLLEVFCEALGAAIFVTDKLDRHQLSPASDCSISSPSANPPSPPGGRARDLYGALL
jgi:hypothetical protein